ncbi:MAG: O-antigen ligase family protein [Lachnospiraceae bacterium]|nr:O-antigen ligase family protein [Lachnospiraceae bacterium]
MKNILSEKYQTLKKQYKEMNVLQLCRAFLRMLLLLVTVGYFFVMAAGLPFYFDTETDYTMIGTNKADFFREYGFWLGRVFLHILVFYVVAALVCYFWENRKVPGKLSNLTNALLDDLSLTDKFAIVYALALFLSYYYSEYPDMAVLGAHGWYMGFWPQAMLLGSYFATSRLFQNRSKMFAAGAACLLLGVSFIVFVLGILNRYGINPLGMDYAGPGFISTIGNINWYCGYWSVTFPLGAGWFLFLEQKTDENTKKYLMKKSLLLLYTAVGFAAGITQGSDSCLLVLAALILLGGSLAVKSAEKLKQFLEMLFTFCVVAGVLALIQKWFPEQNQYTTGFYKLLTGTSFFAIAGVCLFVLYILLQWKTAGKGKKEEMAVDNVKIANFQEKVVLVCKRIWFILLGLFAVTIVSCVALAVINTTNPGSIGALSDNPAFTFEPGWGNGRGATWSAGVRTWTTQDALHKMIGVGPDCMAAHIYDGPDGELLEAVRAQFGNSRLTNAHNEWISILANLGLFGLVGFAGMMISAVVRFLTASFGSGAEVKNGTEKNTCGKWNRGCSRSALCMACGVALLCYTANNMVSFQQIMNISQMFLVMGLGEALCRRDKV